MIHATTIKNLRIRVPNGMNFEYAPTCACGWRLTGMPMKDLKVARKLAREHRKNHKPWVGYFNLSRMVYHGDLRSPLSELGTIVGGHGHYCREDFLRDLPANLRHRVPHDLLVDCLVYVDARLDTLSRNNHRGRSTFAWLTRWQERIMMGLRLHQEAA